MVTSYISLHLSLSRSNFSVPPNKVSTIYITFFVGTRVEKETNQLSLNTLTTVGVWNCNIFRLAACRLLLVIFEGIL